MAERVTPEKQAEEHNFLGAVMATRPMQYVHSYLAQKVGSLPCPSRQAWICICLRTTQSLGSPCLTLQDKSMQGSGSGDIMGTRCLMPAAVQNLVAGQPEVFQQQLHQMWFSFYSRSNTRDDTSGFEHGKLASLSCLTCHPMPCLRPLNAAGQGISCSRESQRQHCVVYSGMHKRCAIWFIQLIHSQRLSHVINTSRSPSRLPCSVCGGDR